MLSVRTFHGNCSGMENGTGEFCASDFTRIYDGKDLEQLQNQRINDIVQIADMAVNKPCATVKIRGSWLENSRLLFSQSELRLPLLQVVSNNKSFSVGVQSPTEINAPRGCAVILRRICQLSLTRITHQVSRAFDLN